QKRTLKTASNTNRRCSPDGPTTTAMAMGTGWVTLKNVADQKVSFSADQPPKSNWRCAGRIGAVKGYDQRALFIGEAVGAALSAWTCARSRALRRRRWDFLKNFHLGGL